MMASKKAMTPLEILRAIESLSEEQRETLAILADKKLTEELLKRREEAALEMGKGELLSKGDLLAEHTKDVRT